ncbi:MAG: associated Golgi protein [Schumannella sp.]|nr:associated Golgi protein [Schumannella sp.]
MNDPGGLVGFALWLIDTIGEWGVGAFTVLETVFPPIPSEVVLPLAGYQGTLGKLSLPLLFIASTAGSYAGALILYGLGRALGLERSIRGLARLPLVDRDDFERAAAWFDRHGKAAVFFGRLVPGVRSLISLPAGASHMSLLLFSALTIAGSAIWNTLLIGLGAALGTQYELVDRYSSVLNDVVYAAIAGCAIWLVVRWMRRRRRAETGSQAGTSSPDV